MIRAWGHSGKLESYYKCVKHSELTNVVYQRERYCLDGDSGDNIIPSLWLPLFRVISLLSLFMEVGRFKFSELLNMTNLSENKSQDKLPTAVLDVHFNALADVAFHMELKGI